MAAAPQPIGALGIPHSLMHPALQELLHPILNHYQALTQAQQPNIRPNFGFIPVERNGNEMNTYSLTGGKASGPRAASNGSEQLITQPITQQSTPTPVQQRQINNIQAAQNGSVTVPRYAPKQPVRIQA